MTGITEFGEREKIEELDGTETVSLGDLSRISTFADVARGRKRFPAVGEVVASQKERARKAVRRGARTFAEGAVERIVDYVFGKKYGKKIYDSAYDLGTYRIVKHATDGYLSGHSELEFIPAEYGSKALRYKGRSVLGVQDGRRSYYVDNPRAALGSAYKGLVEKSGLVEDHFDEAFRHYVKVHESAEAAIQKYALKDELSEDEHGKLEAYTLKALKEAGATPVYRVAALVDGKRTDEFGQKIRKYLTDDIKFDFQRISTGRYQLDLAA